MVADITGRDTDGELLATPTEWDTEESGPAPKIRIHVPRRPQPGTAAGVGDRALMRVEKLDEGDGALYRGRVIKVHRSRPHARCSASSGKLLTAADGSYPSTRSRPAAN